MGETVYYLLIWLGVTSALAFVLFGWDKLMAKLRRRAGHGGLPSQDPQALVPPSGPRVPPGPRRSAGLVRRAPLTRLYIAP